MGKFLFGVVMALLIAAGLYFYMVIGTAQEEAPQEQQGASLDLQIDEKRIPPGAVMEDGTLPE
ncbi:MAG: hypothetical protein WA021_02465 [Minisyncoccia bacterium]